MRVGCCNDMADSDNNESSINNTTKSTSPNTLDMRRLVVWVEAHANKGTEGAYSACLVSLSSCCSSCCFLIVAKISHLPVSG